MDRERIQKFVGKNNPIDSKLGAMGFGLLSYLQALQIRDPTHFIAEIQECTFLPGSPLG